MSKLSKVREIISDYLGLRNGTCYWLSRVLITEGIDKGMSRDIYLFKKDAKHYAVFYDYINDYVAFAYDFKNWNTQGE